MSSKGKAGTGAESEQEGTGSATGSYRESFGVLQRHAETLRNQREPDIDSLLPIVTESVAAFQDCLKRIDGVEKAMEQALRQSGVDAPAGAADRPA